MLVSSARGSAARERLEHRPRAEVAPARAMRKRNVVSRSALGRSDRRATSSRVGRVVGRRRAARPPRRRVGLRERPGDERPRRARARRARRRARPRLLERRHVARLHGDLGQHEPAPEVPLGAAQHASAGPDVHRDGRAAHERDEELDAHRDAVALLDHRRELREQRAVGLAAGDARELGAERQVRLPARRDLREQRRQLGVAREARRAERRGPARLVARERLAQERQRLAVLRLGEGAQPARVELALTRAPPQEHARRLAERRAQRRAERARPRGRRRRAWPRSSGRRLSAASISSSKRARARLVEQLGARERRSRCRATLAALDGTSLAFASRCVLRKPPHARPRCLAHRRLAAASPSSRPCPHRCRPYQRPSATRRRSSRKNGNVQDATRVRADTTRPQSRCRTRRTKRLTIARAHAQSRLNAIVTEGALDLAMPSVTLSPSTLHLAQLHAGLCLRE